MIERYTKLFETCPEGTKPRGGKCAKKDNSGYLKGKCDKGHIPSKDGMSCVPMTEEFNDIVYYELPDEEDSYFDDITPTYSDDEYDYYEIEDEDYEDDEDCASCDQYGEPDCCLMSDEDEESDYDEIYLEPAESFEEAITTISKVPKKPTGGVYKLVKSVKRSGKRIIVRKRWKKVGGHIDPKRRIAAKRAQKKIKAKGASAKRRMMIKRRRSLKIRKSRGL